MIGNALRKLRQMIFGREYVRWFIGGARARYADKVGDGTSSSTVMAPVLWICRTFPEAPPAVYEKVGGIDQPIAGHPLVRLLERPNGFYTGPVLWMATMADYVVNGDAYWLKGRDRGGRVVELWFVPSWMMTPRGDETTFITHYEYKPSVETFSVDPSDVVHFRFGLNPVDQRRGYSPLASVLREVYTDDEAAVFTASLLRNMGVPGIVVSPVDVEQEMSDEDVAATKAYLRERYTGENRGEAIVMSGPTKIEQFGFSPEQLLLRELRRIPEERVTAVLGVPAIVAGLGAGLDRSTFTNMGEAREAAYESGIIPTQRIIAEDVRFQLLEPDFAGEPDQRFGFDLSQVRVLQEDEEKKFRKLDVGVRGGWIKRSEARRATGHEVGPFDDVYLVPLNYAAVDARTGRATTFAPASGRTGPADRRASSENGSGTAERVPAPVT